MTIYDVLDRYAEIKSSQDGKKHNYSRAKLKENYNHYVEIWRSHYRGDVPGIHSTTGYNGQETYSITRQSMKLPKLICQKWATGLFSEEFTITLKNDEETEKFRQLSKQIDFRAKLNQAAISGYSLGTSALLASADYETNTETGKVISGKCKLDLIQYDSLFPLVFDQNDIKTIAFIKTEQRKDVIIHTISIHSTESGQATVETITAEVKGENVVFTNPETVKQIQTFNNRQFAWIKPNTLNDFSDVLPFGQSIFADALAPCTDIDLAADGLRRDVEEGNQMTFVGRDLIYESTANEGKKKRILDNTKGKFFLIPQKLAENGSKIKQLFEKSVPEIRAEEFWRVIKDSLNWACMASGLGKNSLDIVSYTTATEVIHSESEKMQNRDLHCQYLEGQIIQLVRALCELSTMTGNPIDASEINVIFEDSVIQDTAEQKKLSLLEIDSGVITKVEYRMKFYGETEQEATAKLEALKTEDTGERFHFMGETL